MDRFITMGEVVKAIGLRGEIKVYPLLDFYEPVLDSSFLVWEDGRRVEVQRHRQAGSCEGVKVKGVDSREAAEQLVGHELGFMSSSYLETEFPRPPGGLPFRYLGREVATVAGAPEGTVDEVRYTGGGFMLVIRAVDMVGGEILIPAVAPILQPDQGLEGTLLIDPPEGLLDVQSG